MKVTVCFKDIKVVVPCGDGNGLVKDLLEDAIARYRKAQSKNSENGWLSLKSVKLLLADGGILDLDDKISDVVDDKEQIQAIFDNNHRNLEEHSDNNGDGMSGSSIGTCSPDIFNDNIAERICSGKEGSDIHVDDVIITEQDFLAESGLRVRRGSEPALCTSSDFESSVVNISAEYPIYSSVIKVAKSRKDPLGSTSSSKIKNGSSSSVGQPSPTPRSVNSPTTTASVRSGDEDDRRDKELIIVLPKSSEALGIHVVPEFDNAGRNIGLLIEKVEPGGRADRDGRLKQGDKITEINFQNLFQVEFSKAQDIFRSAFLAPELQIRLLRPPDSRDKLTEPAVTELSGQNGSKTDEIVPKRPETPKKIPPAVPARNPKTQLSTTTSKPTARLTMQTMLIELIKGEQGLGFSVTTHGIRDSTSCPIYIKNIFPVGAAIEDARLRPGDILVEINGISLAMKTKAEAVQMLRKLPKDSTVELLVSRAIMPPENPVTGKGRELSKPAVRPLSTVGFLTSSTTSSYSDRTEEEDQDEDDGRREQEKRNRVIIPKHGIVKNRNVGSSNSFLRNGFGSLSNINKAGLSDDDDSNGPDIASNLHKDGHFPAKSGPVSTLQKSRKSISMDDLRRNGARSSAAEVSFDDDVDYPATQFHKMRDFNQSFRAAVIEKQSSPKVPQNPGLNSAQHAAAMQQLEKLKSIEDKTSKNKKDQDRGGSGRKFGWFWRFGKGRKSNNERTTLAVQTDPVSDSESAGLQTPLKELQKSINPLPDHPNGPLHQASHPAVHVRSASEDPRQTDPGGYRLQKEDYMIASGNVIQQPQRVPRRNSPGPGTHSMVQDDYYNVPRPYDQHQGQQYGQLYYNPLAGQHGQQQHFRTTPTAEISMEPFYNPPLRSLPNEYVVPAVKSSHPDRGYPKTVPSLGDPNRGYSPFAVAPKHHSYEQQQPYYQDNDPRRHRVNPADYYYNQSNSHWTGPEVPKTARDYFPPGISQSGHYYQRDKFERPNLQAYHHVTNQNLDYGRQLKPHGQNLAQNPCPLDLTRYAVKAQDRSDVAFGYRPQEHELHSRRQPSDSDLQLRYQPSSVYPPYKNVSPGISTNVQRGRDPPTHLHRNSRAIVEELIQNNHYQIRVQQSVVPVTSPLTSDRW